MNIYKPRGEVRLEVPRKDRTIMIRATDDEKRSFADAAESDGMSLSGWFLRLAKTELRRRAREK